MTLWIIIITAVISIIAFYREEVMEKLMLNPYRVVYKRELYRLLSHGFLHADWTHLIINMIVLYSFGSNVENWLLRLKETGYINNVSLNFSLLYFGGFVISSLLTLFRHYRNPWYNSVGASGSVSAIIFLSIFFAPLDPLYFFAAIPIPGILFAILYLVYSSYMSRRGKDNINHDAHFLGAVYGFIYPLLVHMDLLTHFLRELRVL